MQQWQTFGHQNVKSLLDLQLKSGKFSHAYLFTGAEGIGKKTLALELAGKILQTNNLNIHSDFSVLDQTEDISVERMQQFMAGLSFKPFAGQYKVAVINNAHLMNTQSANALLKTLEEPSPSTILILVSANKDLLPTIVSRCQPLFFNSLSQNQLQAFALERGLKADPPILKLSFGRVDKLMFLQDKNNLAEEQKNINEFELLKSGPTADKLLAITKFAELEPENLRGLFCSWLFWQRQALAQNQKCFASMPPILAALEQLKTNKNKKLILQDLFLKIS